MDSSSERTTLPTPGLETHKPPELWKIIVCCLSHLVFGNFFQQPPETNRVMQHAVSPPLSHHLAPTLILLIPAGGNQNFFWKVCVLRDSALITVTVWLRGKQKSSVARVQVPDKQKATRYEIMADAHLHLSRWRKVCMSVDVYSQKSSASTHKYPTKDTLQSYSTVCTLLKQFPKDRCVSILWTSRACHPHWSLYSVTLGSTALLVPEALTTSNLMTQAHIICHL